MKLQNLIHIVIGIVCFALLPIARAVNPPPDGGYPNENTAEGDNALLNLTSGYGNTAVGSQALMYNTFEGFNTAIGGNAMGLGSGGYENTAIGYFALYRNTGGATRQSVWMRWGGSGGYQNTAIGLLALYFNANGGYNTATGVSALLNNTIGNRNTATGVQALYKNNGNHNTANGFDALFRNTTGIKNTANGSGALLNNTTGNGNVAEGAGALGTNGGSYNTALGFNAGAALTTGHDNVDIQAAGIAGESNTMRIGGGKQTATFITGIRGVTTRMANAIPVLIDSAGQLGTTSSSRRFKKEIQPMDKASESILALKPVTFHYKSDAGGTPQFGLIAEEVAKVNPDLVVRDENGEIYTVRYDAVNAMLLNEFLKEHKAFVEEQHKVQELEANAEQQQKQIEALTAGLQKVSAQLEASKSVPRVVNNP